MTIGIWGDKRGESGTLVTMNHDANAGRSGSDYPDQPYRAVGDYQVDLTGVDHRGGHHRGIDAEFHNTESVFVKHHDNAPIDFFAAEAAGLAWLANAGVPVVKVHAFDARAIALDRLHPVPPSASAAAEFGSNLARLHRSGASAFGSPPPGYTGQSYIGSQSMTCTPTPSWGVFYANQRVLPYVDAAERVGNLTPPDAHDVRMVCRAIADGCYDDGQAPARLHGDLWSGNVIYTERGVVMIDPAAHGGHRETDIAMLDLFGCAYFDDVVDGYGRVWPLTPRWRERLPLHQLHPLAVHAVGHGPSYGRALGEAARATAALN